MRAALVLLALLLAGLVPAAAPAATTPVGRDLQPVVIGGALLHGLAAPVTYVERPPLPFTEEQQGDGFYVPAQALGVQPGWPVDRIGALAWDGEGFVRIPLQVDERFARYLTNYASDFGIYSQADMELTYAFDWEGKRKECERADDPLTAAFCPGPVTTPDPVPGLDHDDEVVVLWRDLGPRAPILVPPLGMVGGLHELAVADPLTAETRYVYVGRLSAPHAPIAPQVTYAPDADSEAYILSNHGGYGGAPGGACHLGDGVDAPFGETNATCPHRRPKDSATVTGASYQFHYSGRWTLDGLRVKQPDGSWSESLIDRWKGRAFQQREGNAADVGGYEDERDWTRSSVTLGVRAGPLRVLRETWGADSGTHVTRLEVFYPHLFAQVYHLRVHPIPPDGIYAFWDHRAGAVDTYYTMLRPDGVRVDGQNDELYGTNSEWQEDVLGEPYFTIDAPDPTLQGVVANGMWDQVSGARGSTVSFIHTPSPAAGALTPYYRDDLGFDDGTGFDPTPAGAGQGSFGAHGIHFFFTSDTDNLFLPAPINEFVAETRQYVFSGRMPNVGEDIAAMERAPLLVSAV